MGWPWRHQRLSSITSPWLPAILHGVRGAIAEAEGHLAGRANLCGCTMACVHTEEQRVSCALTKF